MVWLRCPSCGHVWNYRGEKLYTTCPRCRTTLSVRKNCLEKEDSTRYVILILPIEEFEKLIREGKLSLNISILGIGKTLLEDVTSREEKKTNKKGDNGNGKDIEKIERVLPFLQLDENPRIGEEERN